MVRLNNFTISAPFNLMEQRESFILPLLNKVMLWPVFLSFKKIAKMAVAK